MYPTAREELIVENLTAETVVYDPESHRAYCLNQIVAFVWKQCDGRTSEEEIAKRLPAAGLPADPDIVRLALCELSEAKLLADEGIANIAENTPSRRELVGKLAVAAGFAAALMPAITSIVAPTPAMAASGLDGEGDGAPGHSGSAPGHGGTPPGQGGTPPGQ